MMRRLSGKKGFTLMEAIAVLLILGIAAAVITVRGLSATSYSLAAETETLKAHLRYAHYRAMSDTEPWGMAFTENSYSLLKNMAPATTVLPNEASATHTLGSGITISSGAGSSVNFNDWGNPVNTAGTLLTADRVIVLSDGTSTQIITITQNTGFIP